MVALPPTYSEPTLPGIRSKAAVSVAIEFLLLRYSCGRHTSPRLLGTAGVKCVHNNATKRNGHGPAGLNTLSARTYN
jgi:hypothetical protein